MSSFPVLSLYRHLTGHGHSYRQCDYDALKTVNAVKRRPVNGYAHIQVGKRLERLDAETAGKVTAWCGEMFAAAWQPGWPRSVQIVPVPSSTTVLMSRVEGAPHCLAVQVAHHLPSQAAIVSDVLSFLTPQRKAHSEAGTRDARKLFANMHCDPLPCDLPVLLVDDVMTTGGHLQAAEAHIADVGGEVIGALVVARCEHSPDEDPLVPKVSMLPRFRKSVACTYGLCIRCGAPATVEAATCMPGGHVISVCGDDPVYVDCSDDGSIVVLFANDDGSNYEPSCQVCGPGRPIEYEFGKLCAYCVHMIGKD